jgi:hypothetical protein
MTMLYVVYVMIDIIPQLGLRNLFQMKNHMVSLYHHAAPRKWQIMRAAFARQHSKMFMEGVTHNDLLRVLQESTLAPTPPPPTPTPNPSTTSITSPSSSLPDDGVPLTSVVGSIASPTVTTAPTPTAGIVGSSIDISIAIQTETKESDILSPAAIREQRTALVDTTLGKSSSASV